MIAWSNIKTNETVSSFHDVMSEQLAHQIQSEDEKRLEEKRLRNSLECLESLDEDLALKLALEESLREAQMNGAEGLTSEVSFMATQTDLDTDSDQVLAQVLQNEWNKEHNTLLELQEKQNAGNSKVTVSLEKYRFSDTTNDISDDSDDAYDSFDDDPLDNILTSGNYSVKVNPKYKGGKDEPTKHDAEICGRRNAAKLVDVGQLPPEFPSGDVHDLSAMQLSNSVYNRLKVHCKSESKRSHRLHEKKEHSTADHAVDARTRLLLYKMVNNGTLESVNGIMAVGKESVVILGEGGVREDMEIPRDCVVKIYKTTLTEFKHREMYVRGDHRFSKDEYSRQNPRKIIKMWAAKENANLKRMERCGVPCPHVAILNKHILVMSLIGSRDQPAPQLKTVSLSPVDAQLAFDQTVNIMKTLHEGCELVHADLSPYNLLWHNSRIYVIDVSQAVELTHPLAMEFLYRDCRNITSYFRTIGVYDVPTTEALFCDVTGMSVSGEGAIFLSNVKQFEKESRQFVDLPDKGDNPYQFEYLYDLASTERECERQSFKSDIDIDAL